MSLLALAGPTAATVLLALVAGCIGGSPSERDGIARADSVAAYDARAEAPRPGRAPLTPIDSVAKARPVLPALPDGFVRLADVAPAIGQEMRYFAAYNFVGEPIDGYRAPTCILTRAAAEALAAADADLAARGLGLKVYDCYRPQAAVDHFARWARSGQATMKRGFYPTEPTATLFQRGYIASRSGHTRGSTVDLTLVRRPASAHVQADYPDPAAGPLPRCDRSRPERFDDGDLDMGTAFDCLSTRAATDGPGFSASVRRNRAALREALEQHGFRNYSKEWWHFTLRDEPFPQTYFDFPVE